MNPSALLEISPFAWPSILAALASGGIVGLERQLRGKPVGIRTAMLIVVGTYLFVTAANHVMNQAGDPSRIIGQIVTGVGFLGAGVMLAKDGVVLGVTSAATIWALAALGCCVAIVGGAIAFKLALVVVGVLYGVDLLESYSSAFTRGVHARYSDWRNSDGRGGRSREEG